MFKVAYKYSFRAPQKGHHIEMEIDETIILFKHNQKILVSLYTVTKIVYYIVRDVDKNNIL